MRKKEQNSYNDVFIKIILIRRQYYVGKKTMAEIL